MKQKLKDPVIILAIIVTVLVIIFSIILYLNYNKYKSINNNLTIKELHNYLLVDDITKCGGAFNYSSNLITIDRVENSYKLCLAYYHLDNNSKETNTLKTTKKDKTICKKNNMIFKSNEESSECSIHVIKKDTINNTYKDLFNEDISKFDEFKYGNDYVCYFDKDSYYCGLPEVKKYDLNNKSIYRYVYDYEDDQNEFIIYDYFLRIENNNCYNSTLNEDINLKCKNKLKDINKINYNFIKEYGKKYKHIYKKNDKDAFYWVSSEPI